jgi:FtsH-binding integral membrane protein
MEIALVFMSVDETLAGKVLALTASTAFGCAIVGLYSGIDFSFMGGVLFFALLILIAGNTFRLLMNVIEWKHRLLSLCGIFTFIGYLIFDFNKLSKLSTHIRPNTWLTAMDLSISIYLDIINLFLDLLDYISKLI